MIFQVSDSPRPELWDSGEFMCTCHCSLSAPITYHNRAESLALLASARWGELQRHEMMKSLECASWARVPITPCSWKMNKGCVFGARVSYHPLLRCHCTRRAAEKVQKSLALQSKVHTYCLLTQRRDLSHPTLGGSREVLLLVFSQAVPLNQRGCRLL